MVLALGEDVPRGRKQRLRREFRLPTAVSTTATAATATRPAASSARLRTIFEADDPVGGDSRGSRCGGRSVSLVPRFWIASLVSDGWRPIAIVRFLSTLANAPRYFLGYEREKTAASWQHGVETYAAHHALAGHASGSAAAAAAAAAAMGPHSGHAHPHPHPHAAHPHTGHPHSSLAAAAPFYAQNVAMMSSWRAYDGAGFQRASPYGSYHFSRSIPPSFALSSNVRDPRFPGRCMPPIRSARTPKRLGDAGR